jgi:hypothetical protein
MYHGTPLAQLLSLSSVWNCKCWTDLSRLSVLSSGCDGKAHHRVTSPNGGRPRWALLIMAWGPPARDKRIFVRCPELRASGSQDCLALLIALPLLLARSLQLLVSSSPPSITEKSLRLLVLASAVYVRWQFQCSIYRSQAWPGGHDRACPCTIGLHCIACMVHSISHCFRTT